jgi:aminoglycoside phosphotransferase (APT) family kinase protein
MEEVQGEVIRDRLPEALSDVVQRRRIGEELLDALVELHAADWQTSDLKDIGRSSGYLARQLRRWGGQWQHARTRDIPTIDRVGELLETRMPGNTDTTLVHGDYKLDNAIFAPAAPARVVAVLDWEMATLGDPLTDVALLLAYHALARLTTGQAVADACTAPGFLSDDEVVERYSRGGRDLSDLGFYLGLAYFKIAVILEGIHYRHLHGQTVGEGFDQVGDAVEPLLEAGLSALKEHR